MRTSGLGSSSDSAYAGVYGSVCTSASRYTVCTAASAVPRTAGEPASDPSDGLGAAEDGGATGASSTSGATAVSVGAAGRAEYLYACAPVTAAPVRAPAVMDRVVKTGSSMVS